MRVFKEEKEEGDVRVLVLSVYNFCCSQTIHSVIIISSILSRTAIKFIVFSSSRFFFWIILHVILPMANHAWIYIYFLLYFLQLHIFFLYHSPLHSTIASSRYAIMVLNRIFFHHHWLYCSAVEQLQCIHALLAASVTDCTAKIFFD